MAEITQFKGYTSEDQMPDVPKPETPPDPMIVSDQDGVPERAGPGHGSPGKVRD